MKKIIALFVLMLGVSFTASAQKAAKPAKPATTAATNTKEANIQKAAIEDAKALNEFIPLSNDQMQAFKGLFESKHRALAENISDERKKSVSETIEMKINATLTPEQVTKLNQNPKLLNQLIGKK